MRETRLKTVTTLLDDIFGANSSHSEVANSLLVAWNDNQSSVLNVLRYLKHFQEEGKL